MSARSCVFVLTVGAMLTACQVEVSTGPTDPPPPQTTPPTDSPVKDAGVSEPAGPELDYVACLTELAFGQPEKVVSFYGTVERAGESITVSLQPLATENNAPPARVSTSGLVGEKVEVSSNLQDGSFALALGTLTVPGAANPISGSDIVIEGATLTGTLSCARLGGHITKPEAANRELDQAQNICRFIVVKDGDPRPALTSADFNCAK